MARSGAMVLAGMLVTAAAAMVYWGAGPTTNVTAAPAGEALTAAGAEVVDNQPLNVFYIDRDGDGFGVNAPQGPDADDTDAAVTTYASAIEKHGDVKAFVNHLGYFPDRIREGLVVGSLRPGDMVIVPGGVYDDKHSIDLERIAGSADKPVILLAKPGEKVVFRTKQNAITIQHCRNLILDGFTVDGSIDDSNIGIVMHWSQNISLRHLDVFGWNVGMQAAQDLHSVLIEESVFHDQDGSHGIYLASRDLPNSDLTVRNCLLYRNKNGFQHNGRVTNLLMENNVIHSNWLAGISWLQGVSDSTIRNNLIFNNSTQGIVINLYDDTPTSGIFAYDEVNNVIEHNTIWVGKERAGGPYDPADQPAISINDATVAQGRNMNATIRGNILVTYAGPTIRLAPAKFATGTTIEQNLIYKLVPQDRGVMLCGEEVLEFDSIARSGCTAAGNCFADPKFKNASIEDAQNPEKFNFARP